MIQKKILYTIAIFFAGIVTNAFGQTDSSGKYYNSFDGTKIYYEVRGSGPTVVLVHGFIVNGESWKRTSLYNELLKSGFQVITLDMRGNGKSDKPHDPKAYENDAETKDIMGLLSSLGVKSYSAVGYSRGSIITSRLLVQDKRIRAAVIGGMGSDFTDTAWPRRKMFYRALIGEDVPELASMVKYVKDSGLDQLALAYLQKSQPSTSPTELSKVNKPVLIICGTEDSDNGSSESLTKLIPGAIHRSCPGDHGAAVRTPEFSTEVISFLKGNSL
ncbi:MAG: alpha/beta hydrolase [Bacteroidetes bacterium]|nr:MAG: alpha/beta hydrolase [Bacteroidota bacterium]